MLAPDVAAEPTPPITLERAKRMFREALMASSDNDILYQRDSAFYHGDQIPAEEKAKLFERGQPDIYINRLAPALNGILGIFDAAESDPQAYPRNPEQQDAADIATKLLRFLADKGKLKEVRRVASENYFIEGTCAVLVGDGAQQGDKSLRITPIFWEHFFGDPLSVFNDYEDARFVGIAKWLDSDTLEALYPEKYKELGSPFETGNVIFDTRQTIEENSRWIDTERKRIRVIEMYFKDHKAMWQRMVFCQRGFLDFGESVYKDDEDNSICPIVAASFALRRSNGYRYGALRHAVDPQKEINSRRSKLLHVTNSRQVQTTVEGADPKKKDVAKREAGKPDGVMPFGYEVRNTQDMAEGQMLLLNESQADIDRMAPTPAVLGRMGSGDSGRAREILQQAGYTEWSRSFARLEILEMEIYKRLWWGARQFLTDKMVVRITGEMRASQFLEVNVPQMGPVPQPVMGPDGQPVVDPHTGRPAVQMGIGVIAKHNELARMDLDITLATVPASPTLEMEVWTQLLQYAASMQVRVSDPEFKFLIMASPLPNKTSTLERMEAIREKASEESAPAQQQQQQMVQQEAALKAQHTQSKSAKDMAQARKAEADASRTEAETYQLQMEPHYLRGVHGFSAPVNPMPIDPTQGSPQPQMPQMPQLPDSPVAPPPGQLG